MIVIKVKQQDKIMTHTNINNSQDSYDIQLCRWKHREEENLCLLREAVDTTLLYSNVQGTNGKLQIEFSSCILVLGIYFYALSDFEVPTVSLHARDPLLARV